MKGILEYLKVENISHPAPSDLEIGMVVEENISIDISKFVSEVFNGEIVTFNCKSNGVESSIVVVSETKKLQFTNESNTHNFSYIITDKSDLLLESNSDKTEKRVHFTKKLNKYGSEKGWKKGD